MTSDMLCKFLLLPIVLISCFRLFLVDAGAATFRIHERQELDNEALDSVQAKELGIVPPDHEVSRNSFPSGFVFGSATSASQIEGGALEGGKGPSCWDIEWETPGKILDGSNGSVASDSYHKYEVNQEDLTKLGLYIRTSFFTIDSLHYNPH